MLETLTLDIKRVPLVVTPQAVVIFVSNYRGDTVIKFKQ